MRARSALFGKKGAEIDEKSYGARWRGGEQNRVERRNRGKDSDKKSRYAKLEKGTIARGANNL